MAALLTHTNSEVSGGTVPRPSSSRLLSDGALKPAEIGEGAMGFVCRTMGYEDLVALEFALVTNFDAAKDVIDRVIGSNESKADK